MFAFPLKVHKSNKSTDYNFHNVTRNDGCLFQNDFLYSWFVHFGKANYSHCKKANLWKSYQ